jgi:hypothetical protein
LARALERIGARLPPGSDVVVAAGADDPGLASALPPGPRVIVPALSRRPEPPWTAPLLGTAAAIVVLDPSEATVVGANPACPIVRAGIPRPASASRERGVDPGGHAAMESVWRAEVGPLPEDGPGVAWIGGRGAAPVAAAAEAWSAGRAVVALPGTPRHDMLRRGGALFARTSLEALEATRLLTAARPLTEALAARGARALQALDTVDEVAEMFAEAMVLASGGGDGR